MAKAKMIEGYLSKNMISNPLYVPCVEARLKYIEPDRAYYYTDEDYDNMLMLASAWSAVTRKAWRIFVLSGLCEPFEFWNGFVTTFTFHQGVFMKQDWENLEVYHPRLLEKINKTSNPCFIKGIISGFSWKDLHEELRKMS